jgi:hypothetical protein
MKKTKGIGLIFLSLTAILLMALLLAVPAAQAREPLPAEGNEPVVPLEEEKEISPTYDPGAFSASWGTSPDLLVDCDPDGSLLAGLNPGSVQTSHRLNGAACQKQAQVDAELAALDFKSAGSGGSCGYTGVSGDSRMLKINPVYTETRFVYLQCGKKVAEFGPPSCSCGGNWRYTYDCKKPPTVYISIPCH